MTDFTVFVVLLTLVCACAFPSSIKTRILVVAHRGAHEEAPENTLAAFRKAIELGCDYVEVDVRRTKDGALVLMHDRSVDRTTNGTGNVADLTLADIRALDVGIKRGAQWAGERVPTFDEALTLCKGKVRIYVDNKAGPPDQVIAEIEKHKMLKDVVIYDSPEACREFKKLRSKVWIMPGHPKSVEAIAELARDLKPETLDGNVRDWTQELADAAHRADIQVWVDNLGKNDNETGFRKSLAMGVDAIQTDHPGLLLRFLKEKGRR